MYSTRLCNLIRIHLQPTKITMVSLLITLSPILLFFFLFLLSKFRNFLSKTTLPLPPGPRGLPIIGNLHQLDISNLPDHLWHLSKRYGPLMSLRLGQIQAIFVSSAEIAKEIFKTNDLVFCTRPVLTGQKKFSYNNKDIAFSPYNEHWRQMRKICTLNLFSSKQVSSFRSIREDEVFDMIDTIKSTKKVANLSELMIILTSNMISRVAFGKRPYVFDDGEQKQVRKIHQLLLDSQAMFVTFYYRDHFPFMGWLLDVLNGNMARLEKNFHDLDDFYQELIDEHLNRKRSNKMKDDMVDILLKIKQDYSNSSVEFTFDHIKGVLMNILFGGTDTSAATVVWAMTLLIKNPESMKKVQQEVRNVIGKKGKVEEDDLQKLYYLKAVVKETLRLYPVVPLIVPREARDRCILDGYEIPRGTMVYVNAWAIGRDPKCWENPEEFKPERFMGSSIDYKGADFELIPFGSGRRVCPGMSLAIATVELSLSNLVYSFDWELPNGEKDIDTLATLGVVSHKKNALRLVAKVYDVN